jgi:hypothetical protein
MRGMAIGTLVGDRLVLKSCVFEARIHIRMASQAHLPSGGPCCPGRLAPMRVVAGDTRSNRDGPMDKVAFEFIFRVTLQAKPFRCLRQARRPSGSGDLMTKSAHLFFGRHAQGF